MSKPIHNFKDSLTLGQRGEEIVIDYLRQSPAVTRIIDVTDHPIYQELDVDLLVKMTHGPELKLEIKTDRYTSGNFYYETISAEETESIGGFEKTEADYLFYYFIKLGKMYIIDMKEYKAWFRDRQPSFDIQGYKKQVKNYRRNQTDTYTSIGYAFPTALLTGNAWVHEVYVNT